jgi:hypothetical protein
VRCRTELKYRRDLGMFKRLHAFLSDKRSTTFWMVYNIMFAIWSASWSVEGFYRKDLPFGIFMGVLLGLFMFIFSFYAKTWGREIRK